jgi:hypothetical protein
MQYLMVYLAFYSRMAYQMNFPDACPELFTLQATCGHFQCKK